MATRMVSTLFVLLTVLAVGTAQKGCCFPQQYVSNSDGIISTVYGGSVNTLNVYYGQIAFDVPNNRQAQIFQGTVAGQMFTYRTILDYTKNTLYNITDNGKTCTKMPYSGKIVSCIPDNAIFQGNSYLADHKLSIRSWTYSIVGHNALNATLVVSTDECIPLSSTVETSLFAGVSSLVVTGFTNYTKGIADPAKFFTIPKHC